MNIAHTWPPLPVISHSTTLSHRMLLNFFAVFCPCYQTFLFLRGGLPLRAYGYRTLPRSTTKSLKSTFYSEETLLIFFLFRLLVLKLYHTCERETRHLLRKCTAKTFTHSEGRARVRIRVVSSLPSLFIILCGLAPLRIYFISTFFSSSFDMLPRIDSSFHHTKSNRR